MNPVPIFFKAGFYKKTVSFIIFFLSFTHLFSQAPVISYFSPAAVCEGVPVIIYGQNFTGASAVTFGGKPAAIFRVDASNKITAQPAFGSTGAIAVTTFAGTAISNLPGIVPAPVVNAVPAVSFCNGTSSTPVIFSGTAQSYEWANTNAAIGLPLSGNGNIASFKPVNSGTTPVKATITVTPKSNQYALISQFTGRAGFGAGKLSFLNTQTKLIDSSVEIGSGPLGVAVNPLGNKAYVTTNHSTNLYVIDVNAKSIAAIVPVGANTWGVAVNNTGNKVYTTTADGRLLVINAVTNSIAATIPMPSPYGVGILPAGNFVYVANYLSNTVSVIDAASNSLLTTIPVGAYPQEIAVSADSRFVYVSNHGDKTVSAIDPLTNTVAATIPVGAGPEGMATNTDGSRLYVANISSNDITVINTFTNSVVTTIPVSNGPLGVSVSPDNSVVYAVSSGGMVSQINPFTNTVTDSVVVNGAYTIGKFISGIECYGAPVSFNITVNPTPVATVPNNKVYCSGETTAAVPLSAVPGGVLFDISGGAAIGLANQVNVTAIPSFKTIAGTATITVTPNLNGCTGLPVTFTITIKQAPAAVIIPSGAVGVCNGFPVTISANTGNAFTYQWLLNGAGIAPGGTGSSFTTALPGVYSVIVTSNACPSTSATATVVLNNCAANSIVTQALSQNKLCTGQSINVPFIANGTYVFGNRFRAQLSDANGSFTDPFVVGEAPGTGSGTVVAFIPANASFGTKYRIRVVGDQPVVTGSDNSTDLTINMSPAASINPPDSAFIFGENPTTLTANTGIGLAYQWYSDGQAVNPGGNGQTLQVHAPGSYRVTVTANGCSTISAETKVGLKDCPVFSVNAFSTNASDISIAVTGGVKPYRYSLDSVRWQSNNNFSNLAASANYTVYILDSNSCPGIFYFAISSPSDCDVQNGSGGQGTTFTTQNLGQMPGSVAVYYDMYDIPDQMEIYYNNNLVASTDSVISGPGWLTFKYNPPPGGPYNCTIKMYAPFDGTVWDFTAFCPVHDSIPMDNKNDTICDATFVSPNFPGKYAAATTWIKTITPTSGRKLMVALKAIITNGIDSLSVYDGANTNAPRLATFSGQTLFPPPVTATNAKGQLTFKFYSSAGSDRYKMGWIAALSCTGSGITSFTPAQAETNTEVTITGNGFTGATGVKFGNIAALSFKVISDVEIKAVVGNGASGAVNVTTSYGNASKDGFIYISSLKTCPGGSPQITSDITGEVYQWQVNSGSGFTNIPDNNNYQGTQEMTLGLQSPPTSWYGYQYRCIVDGKESNTAKLIFETTWNGGVSSAFEDAGNWSCNGMPDANTDVIIKTGDILLSSNQSVRSINLAPGAKITARPASHLIITK